MDNKKKWGKIRRQEIYKDKRIACWKYVTKISEIKERKNKEVNRNQNRFKARKRVEKRWEHVRTTRRNKCEEK